MSARSALRPRPGREHDRLGLDRAARRQGARDAPALAHELQDGLRLTDRGAVEARHGRERAHRQARVDEAAVGLEGRERSVGHDQGGEAPADLGGQEQLDRDAHRAHRGRVGLDARARVRVVRAGERQHARAAEAQRVAGLALEGRVLAQRVARHRAELPVGVELAQDRARAARGAGRELGALEQHHRVLQRVQAPGRVQGDRGPHDPPADDQDAGSHAFLLPGTSLIRSNPVRPRSRSEVAGGGFGGSLGRARCSACEGIEGRVLLRASRVISRQNSVGAGPTGCFSTRNPHGGPGG